MRRPVITRRHAYPLGVAIFIGLGILWAVFFSTPAT
jgi:hypothetical protein